VLSELGQTPNDEAKKAVPGEGTGLGLSISHDIIVKQHAGAIEVDTQLGEFTEIRVILPRTEVLV
jgi:signal transduction histidine kinase